jgi:hypothetical protein
MTPLKPFQWCHWNHWNFRPDPHSCIRGVIDTEEIVSAVSMTPLKPPWIWNEKYHWDFNHKHFFAELPISAVSMTPLKWFQRCWIGFRGVNDTAEIRMTLLKPKNDFESPYLILKRTSSKNISWVNIPILYISTLKGPWHEIFDLWFFSPINPT